MLKWAIRNSQGTAVVNPSPRRELAERLLGRHAASAVARGLTTSRNSARRLTDSTVKASNERLSGVRNTHLGETCVIIGNGPSLNSTNMAALADVDTFGLNRFYLMEPRIGWSSTYHVVVNRHVVDQFAGELRRVSGQLFTTWPNHILLAERGDLVTLQNVAGPLFSLDPRRGVWQGATVTYVAMQLAHWMGYRKVILVGVDHRFESKGPSHKLVESRGDDPNHFDPSYFGSGVRWQLPDLETSEVAYRLARIAFERAGGVVLDATVGGALQVFDKVELDEAVSS